MVKTQVNTILWQGDFQQMHSISMCNQRLVPPLRALGYQVTKAPTDQLKPLELPYQPDVFIHHNYPFDIISAPAKLNVQFIQYEYMRILPQHGPLAERLNAFYDLVIVSSQFVKDALVNSGVNIPVEICPLGYDPTEFSPHTPPIQLETDKSFKFMNLGGAIQRKGLDILLEAYTKEFDDSEDVSLIIKAFSYPQLLNWINEQVERFSEQPNGPEVVFEHSEPDSIAGFYSASDVGVYPYRGEGYGLTILESLASGRPVIVTAGGSTDDFCNEHNSWKIESTVVTKKGVTQLDPDVASLQRLMRKAFESGKYGGRQPEKVAASVADVTWAGAAERLSQIIEEAFPRPKRMRIRQTGVAIDEHPAFIYYVLENNRRYVKPFPDITAELADAAPGLQAVDILHPPLDRAPRWLAGIGGQCYEHFYRAKKINPATKLILIHHRFPVELGQQAEKAMRREMAITDELFYPNYDSLQTWRGRQEIELADTIITLDKMTESYFSERYPDKQIERIAPLIPPQKFLEKPGKEKMRFLFWGENPFHQGIKALFTAWDELRLPDAELVCILNGKLALTSKYLLRILMKNPSIQIFSFDFEVGSQGEDLETMMREADVQVCPAQEDGMFLSSMELWGQGKPMIVSSDNGMQEIITHKQDGYIFDPSDPDGLKTGLEYFHAQREALDSYAQAAHKKAQTYSVDRFIKELVPILEEGRK